MKRDMRPVAKPAALICAALLLGMAAAKADDRPFVFAYTTDIETQDEKEFEQELTWTSGHANEAFQAVQLRSELEYGFSDNFQARFI